MATVLIIGASRGIGFETVKAALRAGHSVRSLARSARRIPIDHPKLEKMAGDALKMATVKRAVTGVDAIIQSLGVSAGPEIILKPTRLFSKATRVLVTAMEEAQVKRLICVTGFGAGESTTTPFCIRRRCSRAPSLLRGVSTGGRRATEQCSHDDWMRRSPSARGIAAGVALERRLYAAVITWRATSKAKGLIIEYRCA